MPDVPDRRWFDPVLNAYLHTGSKADEAICGIDPGITIAMDIETPGLDRAFEINCVTLAWDQNGVTNTALINPMRNHIDAESMNWIRNRAGTFIFHNAPFDVPALWHQGWFGPREVNRVVDTLVLARMAWPDPYDQVTGKKNLTALSIRLLGMADFSEGMSRAFKAAGYRTLQAGYEKMDIDSPIYRQGAMADTVATLRLEPLIRQACRDILTNHPFSHFGATTAAQADDVIAITETVNRVMLRRTARGIAVDSDYLNKYRESVDTDRSICEAELAIAGLAGGSGKAAALIAYLDSIGELPKGWPKTATGKLSATKERLEALDHPLATAQRKLAETDKVLGYLEKVTRQSQVTGRCHPQVGILAASATGRMSYSYPELQQFPKDARPVLCADGQGLTSIDYSQIEPVTMGLMAKDQAFLAAYEAGQDLYGPVQEAAGVDRTLAKVVLLATMYGQGVPSLSKRIGKSEDEAYGIRRQMMTAMPESAKWMTKVSAIAENYGRVITAAGRILPVDSGGVFKAVNYVVQGSAYDVLANTICEMERQGLGDHVQLAMHDELVVDTPVAGEVRHIMETPPEFLTRWAGRLPVLRTDRADLGEKWAKV